jgi:hypothetical protein
MVSGGSLVALKALGFRYSHNREAWVHRFGRGRYGPVFAAQVDHGIQVLDDDLAAHLERQLTEPARIKVAPVDERTALPRRVPRRQHERLIPVQWLNDEEHKTVYVDGRPPLVGASKRVKHDVAAKGRTRVVVPIKSSRATG